MKTLLLIANKTDSAFAAVARLALFALVAVTFADVVGRTFLDAPLGYAYELAGVLLGVAVYAGLVGVNWRRDHVKIDLLERVFRRAPQFDKARNAVSWMLEILFFAILGVMVLRQAGSVARMNERFYFLPMEKWVPMTGYVALIVISVVVLLIAIKRTETGEGDA